MQRSSAFVTFLPELVKAVNVAIESLSSLTDIGTISRQGGLAPLQRENLNRLQSESQIFQMHIRRIVSICASVLHRVLRYLDKLRQTRITTQLS